MRVGSVWIEIPNLSPEEPFFTYASKLAFEACEAYKYGQTDLMETICRAIVLIFTSGAKTEVIYEEDLDMYQEAFVDVIETDFIESAVIDLCDCIRKRVTHKKKKERFLRTTIEDMKLSAVLIYMMSIPEVFTQFVLTQIEHEYQPPHV